MVPTGIVVVLCIIPSVFLSICLSIHLSFLKVITNLLLFEDFSYWSDILLAGVQYHKADHYLEIFHDELGLGLRDDLTTLTLLVFQILAWNRMGVMHYFMK